MTNRLQRFRYGHASHPNWRLALQLAIAQVDDQVGRSGFIRRANLGFLYLTPQFGPHAADIVDTLRLKTGVAEWVGSVGIGIASSGVEYHNVPAIAIMLGDFPEDGFQLFSGRQRPKPLSAQDNQRHRFSASALVHADPQTPDLPDLVAEMAERTSQGHLFGGLSSSSADTFQIANDVLSGGLSGVLFSDEVRLTTRVTQGCHPLADAHQITAVSGHQIRELDGRPALDVLFEDLGVASALRKVRDPEKIIEALPMDRISSGLFVGLVKEAELLSDANCDFLVRSLIGIDPGTRCLAVAADVSEGDWLSFCTRDSAAARDDLTRVLTQLRDEFEQDPALGLLSTMQPGAPIRGAIYISCIARGQSLFQGSSVEMELIRRHLGDIPLIGFFAGGEIAASRLHSHSGVLTVFY